MVAEAVVSEDDVGKVLVLSFFVLNWDDELSNSGVDLFAVEDYGSILRVNVEHFFD